MIKADARRTIKSDALKFKNAIIREIDYLWRTSDKTQGIQNFAEKVLKDLQVPKAQKKHLIMHLKNTQLRIAELWDEYFDSLTREYKSNDFEKLLSLYSVDFPNLEADLYKTLRTQLTKSIHSNHSFETLRTNLQNSGLGIKQSYTLANTALSQFDNASHVQFAEQAGIDKFIYDGIRHPDIREFCDTHFKKVFTIDQLKKMGNGQGLPVETSLGGYNCTHYLTAYTKDLL